MATFYSIVMMADLLLGNLRILFFPLVAMVLNFDVFPRQLGKAWQIVTLTVFFGVRFGFLDFQL
jgi:hypothetical protein